MFHAAPIMTGCISHQPIVIINLSTYKTAAIAGAIIVK